MLITIQNFSRDTAKQALELAMIYAAFEREFALVVLADALTVTEGMQRHHATVQQLTSMGVDLIYVVCETPLPPHLLQDSAIQLAPLDYNGFQTLLLKHPQHASF